MTSTRPNVGVRIPAVQPTNVDALRSFVRHTEELGFHSIWVGDHVFYKSDVLEPLELLTWVAAQTSRVRLGTAVLLGAYRHPVFLAKSAAALDTLSNGRLTLGLSIGGTADEYASLGISTRERVPRLLESTALLRRLWTEDDVSSNGRYFSVHHASIHPKAMQQPSIPLYFGAVGKAMRRRAARYADGWVGSAGAPISTFVGDIEVTRSAVAEFGRNPDLFGIAKLHCVSVHRDRSVAHELAERHWHSYYGPRFDVDANTIFGTPSDCATSLSPLVTTGMPELTLVVEPPTLGLQEMDLLAETVNQLHPTAAL
jgi:probable F420-dependent oxidoreductase